LSTTATLRLERLGKPVTQFDDELKKLVDQMFDAAKEHEGIGLAAHQLGKALRVAVICVPEHDFFAMINPELTFCGPDEVNEEGCLSIPGIRGPVSRASTVVLNAFDVKGVPFTMTVGGLLARAIQHEVDHLNGLLFTDRVSSTTKAMLSSKLRKLERQLRHQ
jgi:peptide deformylase